MKGFAADKLPGYKKHKTAYSTFAYRKSQKKLLVALAIALGVSGTGYSATTISNNTGTTKDYSADTSYADGVLTATSSAAVISTTGANSVTIFNPIYDIVINFGAAGVSTTDGFLYLGRGEQMEETHLGNISLISENYAGLTYGIKLTSSASTTPGTTVIAADQLTLSIVGSSSSTSAINGAYVSNSQLLLEANSVSFSLAGQGNAYAFSTLISTTASNPTPSSSSSLTAEQLVFNVSSVTAEACGIYNKGGNTVFTVSGNAQINAQSSATNKVMTTAVVWGIDSNTGATSKFSFGTLDLTASSESGLVFGIKSDNASTELTASGLNLTASSGSGKTYGIRNYAGNAVISATGAASSIVVNANKDAWGISSESTPSGSLTQLLFNELDLNVTSTTTLAYGIYATSAHTELSASSLHVSTTAAVQSYAIRNLGGTAVFRVDDVALVTAVSSGIASNANVYGIDSSHATVSNVVVPADSSLSFGALQIDTASVNGTNYAVNAQNSALVLSSSSLTVKATSSASQAYGFRNNGSTTTLNTPGAGCITVIAGGTAFGIDSEATAGYGAQAEFSFGSLSLSATSTGGIAEGIYVKDSPLTLTTESLDLTVEGVSSTYALRAQSTSTSTSLVIKPASWMNVTVKGSSTLYGLSVEGGGLANIGTETATSLTVSLTNSASDKNTTGVNVVGSASLLAESIRIAASNGVAKGVSVSSSSNLSIGGAKTQSLTISASGDAGATYGISALSSSTVSLQANDVTVSADGVSQIYALYADNNSHIGAAAESFTITSGAKAGAASASSYGLYVKNGTQESKGNIADSASAIQLVAGTSITIDQATYAVSAFSNGTVEIDGNLKASGSALLFDLGGNSTVTINKENGKSAQLQGDIAFETSSQLTLKTNTGETTTETVITPNNSLINSYLTVYLNGAESYWEGSSYSKFSVSVDGAVTTYQNRAFLTDATQKAYFGDVTDFVLKLSDGARWTMTNDSLVNTLIISGKGNRIEGGYAIALQGLIFEAGSELLTTLSTAYSTIHKDEEGVVTSALPGYTGELMLKGAARLVITDPNTYTAAALTELSTGYKAMTVEVDQALLRLGETETTFRIQNNLIVNLAARGEEVDVAQGAALLIDTEASLVANATNEALQAKLGQARVNSGATLSIETATVADQITVGPAARLLVGSHSEAASLALGDLELFEGSLFTVGTQAQVKRVTASGGSIEGVGALSIRDWLDVASGQTLQIAASVTAEEVIVGTSSVLTLSGIDSREALTAESLTLHKGSELTVAGTSSVTGSLLSDEASLRILEDGTLSVGTLTLQGSENQLEGRGLEVQSLVFAEGARLTTQLQALYSDLDWDGSVLTGATSRFQGRIASGKDASVVITDNFSYNGAVLQDLAEGFDSLTLILEAATLQVSQEDSAVFVPQPLALTFTAAGSGVDLAQGAAFVVEGQVRIAPEAQNSALTAKLGGASVQNGGVLEVGVATDVTILTLKEGGIVRVSPSESATALSVQSLEMNGGVLSFAGAVKAETITVSSGQLVLSESDSQAATLTASAMQLQEGSTLALDARLLLGTLSAANASVLTVGAESSLAALSVTNLNITGATLAIATQIESEVIEAEGGAATNAASSGRGKLLAKALHVVGGAFSVATDVISTEVRVAQDAALLVGSEASASSLSAEVVRLAGGLLEVLSSATVNTVVSEEAVIRTADSSSLAAGEVLFRGTDNRLEGFGVEADSLVFAEGAELSAGLNALYTGLIEKDGVYSGAVSRYAGKITSEGNATLRITDPFTYSGSMLKDLVQGYEALSVVLTDATLKVQEGETSVFVPHPLTVSFIAAGSETDLLQGAALDIEGVVQLQKNVDKLQQSALIGTVTVRNGGLLAIGVQSEFSTLRVQSGGLVRMAALEANAASIQTLLLEGGTFSTVAPVSAQSILAASGTESILEATGSAPFTAANITLEENAALRLEASVSADNATLASQSTLRVGTPATLTVTDIAINAGTLIADGFVQSENLVAAGGRILGLEGSAGTLQTETLTVSDGPLWLTSYLTAKKARVSEGAQLLIGEATEAGSLTAESLTVTQGALVVSANATVGTLLSENGVLKTQGDGALTVSTWTLRGDSNRLEGTGLDADAIVFEEGAGLYSVLSTLYTGITEVDGITKVAGSRYGYRVQLTGAAKLFITDEFTFNTETLSALTDGYRGFELVLTEAKAQSLEGASVVIPGAVTLRYAAKGSAVDLGNDAPLLLQGTMQLLANAENPTAAAFVKNVSVQNGGLLEVLVDSVMNSVTLEAGGTMQAGFTEDASLDIASLTVNGGALLLEGSVSAENLAIRAGRLAYASELIPRGSLAATKAVLEEGASFSVEAALTAGKLQLSQGAVLTVGGASDGALLYANELSLQAESTLAVASGVQAENLNATGGTIQNANGAFGAVTVGALRVSEGTLSVQSALSVSRAEVARGALLEVAASDASSLSATSVTLQGGALSVASKASFNELVFASGALITEEDAALSVGVVHILGEENRLEGYGLTLQNLIFEEGATLSAELHALYSGLEETGGVLTAAVSRYAGKVTGAKEATLYVTDAFTYNASVLASLVNGYQGVNVVFQNAALQLASEETVLSVPGSLTLSFEAQGEGRDLAQGALLDIEGTVRIQPGSSAALSTAEIGSVLVRNGGLLAIATDSSIGTLSLLTGGTVRAGTESEGSSLAIQDLTLSGGQLEINGRANVESLRASAGFLTQGTLTEAENTLNATEMTLLEGAELTLLAVVTAENLTLSSGSVLSVGKDGGEAALHANTLTLLSGSTLRAASGVQAERLIAEGGSIQSIASSEGVVAVEALYVTGSTLTLGSDLEAQSVTVKEGAALSVDAGRLTASSLTLQGGLLKTAESTSVLAGTVELQGDNNRLEGQGITLEKLVFEEGASLTSDLSALYSSLEEKNGAYLGAQARYAGKIATSEQASVYLTEVFTYSASLLPALVKGYEELNLVVPNATLQLAAGEVTVTVPESLTLYFRAHDSEADLLQGALLSVEGRVQVLENSALPASAAHLGAAAVEAGGTLDIATDSVIGSLRLKSGGLARVGVEAASSLTVSALNLTGGTLVINGEVQADGLSASSGSLSDAENNAGSGSLYAATLTVEKAGSLSIDTAVKAAAVRLLSEATLSVGRAFEHAALHSEELFLESGSTLEVATTVQADRLLSEGGRIQTAGSAADPRIEVGALSLSAGTLAVAAHVNATEVTVTQSAALEVGSDEGMGRLNASVVQLEGGSLSVQTQLQAENLISSGGTLLLGSKALEGRITLGQLTVRGTGNALQGSGTALEVASIIFETGSELAVELANFYTDIQTEEGVLTAASGLYTDKIQSAGEATLLVTDSVQASASGLKALVSAYEMLTVKLQNAELQVSSSDVLHGIEIPENLALSLVAKGEDADLTSGAAMNITGSVVLAKDEANHVDTARIGTVSVQNGGSLEIGATVKADTIAAGAGGVITVGDESASGALLVKNLELQDGGLIAIRTTAQAENMVSGGQSEVQSTGLAQAGLLQVGVLRLQEGSTLDAQAETVADTIQTGVDSSLIAGDSTTQSKLTVGTLELAEKSTLGIRTEVVAARLTSSGGAIENASAEAEPGKLTVGSLMLAENKTLAIRTDVKADTVVAAKQSTLTVGDASGLGALTVEALSLQDEGTLAIGTEVSAGTLTSEGAVRIAGAADASGTLTVETLYLSSGSTMDARSAVLATRVLTDEAATLIAGDAAEQTQLTVSDLTLAERATLAIRTTVAADNLTASGGSVSNAAEGQSAGTLTVNTLTLSQAKTLGLDTEVHAGKVLLQKDATLKIGTGSEDGRLTASELDLSEGATLSVATSVQAENLTASGGSIRTGAENGAGGTLSVNTLALAENKSLGIQAEVQASKVVVQTNATLSVGDASAYGKLSVAEVDLMERGTLLVGTLVEAERLVAAGGTILNTSTASGKLTVGTLAVQEQKTLGIRADVEAAAVVINPDSTLSIGDGTDSGTLAASEVSLLERGTLVIGSLLQADNLLASGGRIVSASENTDAGKLTVSTLTLNEQKTLGIAADVAADKVVVQSDAVLHVGESASGKLQTADFTLWDRATLAIATEVSAENLVAEGAATIVATDAFGSGVLTVGSVTIKEDGALDLKANAAVSTLVAESAATLKVGEDASGATLNVVDMRLEDRATLAIRTELTSENLVSAGGSIINASETDTVGKLTVESLNLERSGALGIETEVEASKVTAAIGTTLTVGEKAAEAKLTVTELNLKESSTLSVQSEVVADALAADKDAVIYVGDADSAGKLVVASLDLKGAMFLDPTWENGTVASEAAVQLTLDTLTGSLVVGQNSKLVIGSTDSTLLDQALTSIGRTLAKEDLQAAVYLNRPVTLARGASLVVDGSLTRLPEAAAGVRIESNSALIVNMAGLIDGAAAITGSGGEFAVHGFLYLDNVSEGSDVLVAAGFDSVSLQGAQIEPVNRLLAMSVVSTDAGRLSAVVRTNTAISEATPIPDVIAEVAENTESGAGTDAANEIGADRITEIFDVTSGLTDAEAIQEVTKISLMGAASGVQSTTLTISSLSAHSALQRGTEALNVPTEIGRGALWADVTGRFSKATRYRAGNAAYGVKADIGGGALGGDVRVEESVVLGAAFDFGSARVRSSVAASGTKTQLDYYGGSLYGAWQTRLATLSATGGALFTRNEIQQLGYRGKPTARALFAAVRAEKELSLAEHLSVTPHIGLRYTNFKLEEFHAGGFRYSADRANRIELPVGVSLKSEWQTGGGVRVKPALDLTFTPALKGSKAINRVGLETGRAQDAISTEIASRRLYEAALSAEASKGAHSLNLQVGVGLGSGGRLDQTLRATYHFLF